MFAIHQPVDNSPRGQANAARITGGTPRGRLPGGHIADLAALGKAIVLTPDEARKFPAATYGYATNPAMPAVAGYSDASGEFCPRAILFLKKG